MASATYSAYSYPLHVMLRTYGTPNWNATMYFLALTSKHPHLTQVGSYTLEPLCEVSLSTYVWAAKHYALVNTIHYYLLGWARGNTYEFLLSLLEIAFNEPQYRDRILT